MTIPDLLNRLAREGPSGIEEVPAGTSEAFFVRVVQLADRPADAQALARNWAWVERRGDIAGFGYRAKAVAERLAGRWAASAKSFREAGRAALDPIQSLSFQTGAVDSLARAGKVDDAVRLGRRLAHDLEKLGESGLAARVRLNVGNALLWEDRYAAAREAYRRALPHLTGSDLASAMLGLSTAELFGGHPGQAQQQAEDARVRFEEMGLEGAVQLCDLNLCHVSLLTGRPDDALDTLLALQPKLAGTDAARAHEFLGDAYLALNLGEEAIDAYEAAANHEAHRHLPLNRANVQFGVGLALLSLERFEDAEAALKSAEAAYRKLGNVVWCAAVRTRRAQIALRQGRRGAARTLSGSALTELRDKQSSLFEVSALLTLADSLDPGEERDRAISRATALIKRRGLVTEEWKVHALRAAGDPTKLGHYRRMLESILDARLLLRSTVSQTAYLSDKGHAIAGYLGQLLSRPTPARVREALDVVVRTRSVALIDEILSSHADALDPKVQAEFDALRRQIGVESAEGPPGTRRMAGPGTSVAIRRRWIEVSRKVACQISSPIKSHTRAGEAVIFVEAGEDLYAVEGLHSRRLPVTRTELVRLLRRLRFDLLAPAGMQSPTDRSRLEESTMRLSSIFDLPQKSTLCPEGIFWQIPWTMICDDPAVSPIPSAQSDCELGEVRRVAIWAGSAPDLPHVRTELESLSQTFPNARLCQTAAEVRDSLNGRYDLIHVAGHAVARPNNPMFSSLLFPDGPVFATEIARSRLEVKAVSLFACDTANLVGGHHFEPDGLARAFLARSAQAVVGSMWPLSDEASPILSDAYTRALLEGLSCREALRLARAEVRRWNPAPALWAPAILIAGIE